MKFYDIEAYVTKQSASLEKRQEDEHNNGPKKNVNEEYLDSAIEIVDKNPRRKKRKIRKEQQEDAASIDVNQQENTNF